MVKTPSTTTYLKRNHFIVRIPSFFHVVKVKLKHKTSDFAQYLTVKRNETSEKKRKNADNAMPTLKNAVTHVHSEIFTGSKSESQSTDTRPCDEVLC